MILDIKIVNKPTIFHEIILSDYFGHILILLFIFYIFSPNFFILNSLLGSISFICYSIIVVFWPIFEFFVVAHDPIFAPQLVNDPVFFEFCTELHVCLANLLENKFSKVEYYYYFFQSCSVLSVYFYKVIYCVDSWSWSFLPENYFNVNYSLVDIYNPHWVLSVKPCPLCSDAEKMKLMVCTDQWKYGWQDVGASSTNVAFSKFLIDFDSSVKNLQILYTDFTLWFLLCGGVLLVDMVGCISLALPSRQELNVNLSKNGKFNRRIKTVTYKKIPK